MLFVLFHVSFPGGLLQVVVALFCLSCFMFVLGGLLPVVVFGNTDS